MSTQKLETSGARDWRKEWLEMPVDLEFYKEMTALRDEAIASGMQTMTIAEVLDYVRECRGGAMDMPKSP